MTARLDTSIPNKDVATGIQHLYQAMYAGGVDPRLLELIHLRVSQINGCSACVWAGIQSATKAGETDERLHNLVAWRETSFYTDSERAALELAEAATRVEDGQVGVTDPVWEAAAAHFAPTQLSTIVLMVATTNFFNRINRAIKEEAGKRW